MGLKTAQSIIDIAEAILQDSGNSTWNATTEHLAALCDGQREIVALKYDAYIVNEEVQLAAGSKQSLPSQGIFLVDITRNMGVSGGSAGDSISLVDKADMDDALPGWHSSTYASTTVIHFMYNKKEPKVFWVYPAQPAASQSYVQMEYAKLPADIAIGDAITLDDSYAPALMKYILYRAWLKKKPGLAAGFYNGFLADLGLQDRRAQADDPNIQAQQAGG